MPWQRLMSPSLCDRCWISEIVAFKGNYFINLQLSQKHTGNYLWARIRPACGIESPSECEMDFRLSYPPTVHCLPLSDAVLRILAPPYLRELCCSTTPVLRRSAHGSSLADCYRAAPRLLRGWPCTIGTQSGSYPSSRFQRRSPQGVFTTTLISSYLVITRIVRNGIGQ